MTAPHTMAHAAHTTGTHSTIREGIMTGVLGGAAVALWFLIVDAITGQPFYTPAVLGAGLSGADLSVAEGDGRLGLAALYTPVHFLMFAILGVAIVALVHRVERTPSVVALLLMLFVAFEVGFTGLVTLLEHTALGRLAWYQVAAGNLVAALAMGWYVLRRHPGMSGAWGRRLAD